MFITRGSSRVPAGGFESLVSGVTVVGRHRCTALRVAADRSAEQPVHTGGASTAALLDAVRMLWDARVDGVEVWSRATAGGPTDPSVDLLVAMVGAAVGLCTGTVTGAVLAHAVASKRLSSAGQTLIKATLSPLANRVNGKVTGPSSALSSGQPPLMAILWA